MDKQSKALINEIYRLVGATAVQVQNLQNGVSHLESLVRDVHCDVLERPAEKKVVLMKTAPFGAAPSAVLAALAEYEDLQRMKREANRILFERFIGLPREQKLYIYSYLTSDKVLTPGPAYEKYDTRTYDKPEFRDLLSRVPRECIM